MALNYDITSRDWDNTDVNVNITDPDGFNGIKDLDNDNASFSEGTLTDVVAVNDGLELINVYDKVVVYGTDGYTYSGWVDNPDVVANEMINRGWKSKNATEVKTWMDSYISQGDARGAVCLIMGVVTDTIAETQDSNCTLRKFLNVGGRVVWIGDWQLYYVAHSDGTLTNWGQNGSTNILGFTAMSDNVALSSITASGADWGLDFFWNNGCRPINQVDASVVLATNANNNASGWVTYFDSWSAGGFVRIWDYRVKTADLTSTAYGDLNDLAEYNFNYLYDIEGNRQSPQLDLSAIGTIESSSISWDSVPLSNYYVLSGGMSDSNVAIIKVGGTDKAIDTRGINTVLVREGIFIEAKAFDTHGLESESDALESYINSLEEGDILIVSMKDAGTAKLTQSCKDAIENKLYSERIQNLTHRESWLIFSRIGDKKYQEKWSGGEGQGDVEFYYYKPYIETSIDGGSTWQTATNGGAIPNLPADPTTLDVRQTLNTNDTTVTPVLESLEVQIETPIKYKWSLNTTTPSTWNEYQQIKDLDNDNASFSEGTLTDVVAVDDSLQLVGSWDTTGTTDYFGSAGSWHSDTTDEGSIDGFSDVHSITQTTNYDDIFTGQFTTSDFPNYAGSGNYVYMEFWAKWQEKPILGNVGTWVLNPAPDSGKYQKYVLKSDGQNSRDEYFRLFYTTSQDDGSTAYLADPHVYKESEVGVPYKQQGTRQSPQLDLSPVGNVESSSISWQETLNSQTITIETSVDGGSTWQTATNGGAIPNLPSDPTTLDVRQVLSTTDTTVTPVLESLEVQVDEKIFQTQEGQWYLHTEYFENNEKIQEYNGPYNIDKTPPAVPNVNLINNTSHSFSLNWTNQDDLSGVDYVELYAEESDGSLNYVADIDIDGDSNTEPSIQLTNTDTSYTVDGLSEYTNYRYKVRVFDKAGNFSEDTYAEMITDDITGPVVGYNLNSRDWLNTNVDETVNIDDQGGSGLATAWYKWTNSPTQPTDGWIVMGTTTNFATSQSQEGEWYLHIKATDNYNNTAYDYSGPYKIDKTAPVISSTNITIDSPTGVYDTYTATIEWFIEDQQDLSGVDRTEVGFYVDGVWHYNENTLPDGITTNTDMDNITGGGSKTAIFSNVPREIDIAASFNGYDIATNETGEQQISSIFTPRIYATHTLSGKTDYEMGINSEYKSETKYETGINKNYQSPSSQIIDVLSKTYNSPASYEMGKRAKYKSQTLYEAGINKKEGPAPSLQDILVFYDEPIFVSGKFAQGIRLGLSDLEVDISDFNEWTMHVFRRGIDDSEFRTIFINSNGEVYVDNKINNEYDVSWFESTNEKITIKSGAIDIDELLVFPQIIDQKQIDRIGGSPFYDPNENIKVDMPDSVDMEVMQ